MKYAMFQIFCIPTEEMIDPETESHEVEPKKVEPKKAEPKKDEPRKLVCEKCGAEIKPYIGKSGNEVSIEQHVMGSRKKFDGHCYCVTCITNNAI